jgi:hypothetical protein
MVQYFAERVRFIVIRGWYIKTQYIKLKVVQSTKSSAPYCYTFISLLSQYQLI